MLYCQCFPWSKNGAVCCFCWYETSPTLGELAAHDRLQNTTIPAGECCGFPTILIDVHWKHREMLRKSKFHQPPDIGIIRDKSPKHTTSSSVVWNGHQGSNWFLETSPPIPTPSFMVGLTLTANRSTGRWLQACRRCPLAYNNRSCNMYLWDYY